MPIKLVYGCNNENYNIEDGIEFKKNLGVNCSLKGIIHAGHFPHLETTSKLSEIIKNFTSEIESKE